MANQDDVGVFGFNLSYMARELSCPIFPLSYSTQNTSEPVAIVVNCYIDSWPIGAIEQALRKLSPCFIAFAEKAVHEDNKGRRWHALRNVLVEIKSPRIELSRLKAGLRQTLYQVLPLYDIRPNAGLSRY